MVERVESNPFVAGNITVAPRDRQGEGKAEVQEMHENVGWVYNNIIIIDHEKQFSLVMLTAEMWIIDRWVAHGWAWRCWASRHDRRYSDFGAQHQARTLIIPLVWAFIWLSMVLPSSVVHHHVPIYSLSKMTWKLNHHNPVALSPGFWHVLARQF